MLSARWFPLVAFFALLAACAPVRAAGSTRQLLPLAPRGAEIGGAAQVWRWQNPRPQGHPITSTSFASDSVGWGVAAAGNVVNTSDGGQTWALQYSGTTANLLGVAAASTSQAIAVGEGGTIVVTRDGGTSWRPAASGTGAILNAVAAASPATAWAVGQAGTILKTTDGGTTWTSQTSPVSGWPTSAGLRSVAAPSESVAWISGNSGTILTTSDGGSTWTVRRSAGASDVLWRIAAASADVGWAAGSASPDGMLLKTSDGGQTWQSQSFPSASQGQFPLVAPTSPSTAYMNLEGKVYRTTDGGTTWTLMGQPSQATKCSFLGGLVARGSGLLVGSGALGSVFRSTDGGATWSCVASDATEGYLDEMRGVVARSTSVAYALAALTDGQRGQVLKTANGGPPGPMSRRPAPPTWSYTRSRRGPMTKSGSPASILAAAATSSESSRPPTAGRAGRPDRSRDRPVATRPRCRPRLRVSPGSWPRPLPRATARARPMPPSCGRATAARPGSTGRRRALRRWARLWPCPSRAPGSSDTRAPPGASTEPTMAARPGRWFARFLATP